jgi:hypothetical protein
MLFARFLAENGLLIEPQEKMAISLSEAEELAKEDGENVWVFASRCAQVMLPQIFRPDDPLLQVSFAKEHILELEKLLASLPQSVFTASDALGWVYQFWQSKRKDEVNRSEVKIGADEIAAVTQLFTEPYMVEFLLHNTLGAWWAGKKLTANDAASAATEDELRRKLDLPGISWDYLRFVHGKGGPWLPAAGTYDGWPKTAAELKVLDPCCGSGHFLVASLYHLVPIRMREEGLNAREAVDAVLRDNLHGLEIDERCCQIAAFALAFAAWTFPKASGYRVLPELHIACSGIAPHTTKEQWLSLGEEIAAMGGMPAKRDLFDTDDSLLSAPVKKTLEALHELFSQAPVLGSLITPASLRTDLFHADYKAVAPLLAKVLAAQNPNDETREQAIAAAGMVKAADLLAGEFTLVITNVPYLSQRKQSATLQEYCARHYPEGQIDLATSFVQRCAALCAMGGSTALVSPQNWLFLKQYEPLRRILLRDCDWQIVARLGAQAFTQVNGWVVNISLSVISRTQGGLQGSFCALDATDGRDAQAKAPILRTSLLMLLQQEAQLDNLGARIVLGEALDEEPLIASAIAPQGIKSGDDERWRHCFWEVMLGNGWELYQSTVSSTAPYDGRSYVIDWRTTGSEMIRPRVANAAVGHQGVAVSQMGNLAATMYCGQRFDSNVAAIVPLKDDLLPALWSFVSSPQYSEIIRSLDQSLKVTNQVFLEAPFDLALWQKVATEQFPYGLPEPESDDPTQWLFHGRPEESTVPLQVAVARLLGYRWPTELDENMYLSKRARLLIKRCEELVEFADDDGIVCIPSVRGEEAAAEQLAALLTGSGIKPAKARELAGGADLDDWLRGSFFEEHCKLFHDRPFVWHIWDGRKRDGFHALINYHKLCEGKGKGRRLLESLSYAYLGEWIARQKDGVKRGEGGAEDRLAAALELQKRLEAILEGEPPFDLFVRWKPLTEQPIGWEPDINDGVRMNIRPFMAGDLPNGRAGAGVLRWKPNIKWEKDRGKEPERPKEEYPWCWNWNGKTVDFMGTGKEPDGNRWNDCHYTIKAKQAARDAAKKGHR